MINLYLYKHARFHSQDTLFPEYSDTTPFSIQGIKRHCRLVDTPNADYFYIGQICETYDDKYSPILENSFNYLNEYHDKHILDLEGDWPDKNAPSWVINCTKSLGASKKEHSIGKYCVRPCLSTLLMYLGKENPTYEIEFPSHTSFGFIGLPDPHGVRFKMARCINNINVKNQVMFNNMWCAKQSLDSNVVNNYIGILVNNLLSLCPRGTGSQSIRFYETCFFGRIPIIISDSTVMNEEEAMKFAYRIQPDLNDNQMEQELLKIYNTPYDELVERCKMARNYFQETVVKYFQDPTLYFINFLQK